MATYTTKYHLKKPEDTDFFDIADHNGNMDILDNKLAQTETALGKAADKDTLDTIHGKIGTTTDVGGTVQSGTILGKLNTLLGGGALKGIQRGVVMFPTKDNISITISTVNPQKAFVLLNNSFIGASYSSTQLYGASLVELTSTALVLTSSYASSSNDMLFYNKPVSYQVIEFY